MLKNFFSTNKTRWHAFYTWCLGGFHIGWDLGQGLLNYLPQSALGLFIEVEPHSKLFQLPNALNKYFLGPILGTTFAILALVPAFIEGAFFKRPYKKLNDEWTTTLVNKQGLKLFWGALGISALWLVALSAGYIATTLNSALVIPLGVSYGMVALAGLSNLFANLYGSMMKLYVYRTKDIEWTYNMEGVVNIQLENSQEVKDPLNKEFIHELEVMSILYDQAYAQLVQQNNKAPTVSKINKLGVLSYWGLQQEQSTFLTLITQDKNYASPKAKLAAIEERHQQFDKKYGKLA